jgi:hypothetical protein
MPSDCGTRIRHRGRVGLILTAIDEHRLPHLTYTKSMQLRAARLCLDCEEIHDAEECPVCLSEAFAYITRWVPTEERRAPRRFPLAVNVRPERFAVARWVQREVVGLALIAAARWWWPSRTEAKVPRQNNV